MKTLSTLSIAAIAAVATVAFIQAPALAKGGPHVSDVDAAFNSDDIFTPRLVHRTNPGVTIITGSPAGQHKHDYERDLAFGSDDIFTPRPLGKEVGATTIRSDVVGDHGGGSQRFPGSYSY